MILSVHFCFVTQRTHRSFPDPKHQKWLYRLPVLGTRIVNRFFGGAVAFQALPVPFLLYSDGALSPAMEEFPTGARLMNCDTEAERQQLLTDPEFRKEMRKDWFSMGPRMFHRQLDDMWIVSAPASAQHLIGKSFQQLSELAGEKRDALDIFMDLCQVHGDQVRWNCVPANCRPSILRWILDQEDVLIGFSELNDVGLLLAGRTADVIVVDPSK